MFGKHTDACFEVHCSACGFTSGDLSLIRCPVDNEVLGERHK